MRFAVAALTRQIRTGRKDQWLELAEAESIADVEGRCFGFARRRGLAFESLLILPVGDPPCGSGSATA